MTPDAEKKRVERIQRRIRKLIKRGQIDDALVEIKRGLEDVGDNCILESILYNLQSDALGLSTPRSDGER